MTYIPQRVIGLDESDLAERKKKFLQWIGGEEKAQKYGVQFLTFAQAKEQGIEMTLESGYMNPNIYSEKLEERLRSESE